MFLIKFTFYASNVTWSNFTPRCSKTWYTLLSAIHIFFMKLLLRKSTKASIVKQDIIDFKNNHPQQDRLIFLTEMHFNNTFVHHVIGSDNTSISSNRFKLYFMHSCQWRFYHKDHWYLRMNITDLSTKKKLWI